VASTTRGWTPAYEASYGSAGVPPWDNAEGTGAWMSDHNEPVSVAAGKDTIVLVAGGSEGGWSVIGTDLNGRKQWGERRFQGNTDVAVDAQYVYAAMNVDPWHGQHVPRVGRLELKTGKYAPFIAAGGAEKLSVEVATQEEKSNLTAVAVSDKFLAVSLAGPNVVRIYHKQNMDKVAEVAVGAPPGGLAYAADGTLLAVVGNTVVQIADGKATPFITAGLRGPKDLALDAQGRVYITDTGTHQVKVFSKDGKFSHAIGIDGGRPECGAWNQNGMLNPQGVAVDPHGRVWVAEQHMWPKRISVWAADGTFIRDYLGPTTYGGSGAVVDPRDKTRVFGNGVEFTLNYDKNTAIPVAAVIGENLVGDLFYFAGREYFMSKRNALYLRKGDVLMPVARFGGTRLWSDANDDGQEQPEEVQTRADVAPLDGGYWGGYWLDEHGNLYTAPGGYDRQTVGRIPLTGWSKGGTPLWDLSQWVPLVKDRPSKGPNKLFIAGGGQVIVGSPMAAIRDDGTVHWTYPDNWPDVHGSHYAPIPERDDLLVGTLSCIGKADTRGPLGKLFALGSNMGRLYVFTMDGLLVATVFQDCRIGSDPWPGEMKRGAPMGGVTMGGEWFGGHFFKAEASNEYYLIAGGTSYNLIKLNGLDKAQPLKGGAFTYTAKELATAERLQQARVAAASAAKTLTITRLAAAPKIDGKLDDFPKESFVAWGAGQYKARVYWANQATGLVNDVPGEIMATPNLWGTAAVAE
jgi:hypothetical protein